MRITVIGLPGSGKSTLAKNIAKKLSIRHIEIDRFWFESGGGKGADDTKNLEEVRLKVREKTAEAIKGDSWVSDGTYLNVQDLITDRADVILFLDIPLLIRLLGHARRAFFVTTRRHAELSMWNEITFFPEIIRRNFSRKPKLLKFVSEHKDKVVRLRSYREMDEYLRRLY
jgi:adenylate kinase family enzyme